MFSVKRTKKLNATKAANDNEDFSAMKIAA